MSGPASVPDPKVWDQEKIDLRFEIDRLRSLNAEMLALLKSAADVFDSKELNGTIAFAAIHGFQYTGPPFDMPKARAILAKSEATNAD